MVSEEKIQELSSILSKEGLTLAILFGSLASGRERPDSDADLAVAGTSLLSYDQLIDISIKLGTILNREVQIRDLRKLGGTILSQILTKGRIILSKDAGLLANLVTQHLDFQTDINPTFQSTREKNLREYFNG